jgi:hypothetical protein
VKFKNRFNQKDQGDFPMPHKEVHLLVDFFYNTFLITDIEYPFKHIEVINYTLDGLSINPVTTKIQLSFLTQWMERKETAQGFQWGL